MRLGGSDGLGLDVKAQHPPAGGAAQPAQKGGVPAVAAGGIDAKRGGSQPLGQKLLHEAHGGQVRRAAAGQLPALGPEIELCPESLLARVRRGRSREDGGLFAVVSAVGPQHLLQQIAAGALPPPLGQDG